MPRACSVCVHTESAAITKAIGKGVSVRQVASRFGFKHHATIQRHKSYCMGIAPRKPTAPQTAPAMAPVSSRNGTAEQLDPRSLLQRAATLMDDVQAVIDRARTSGDDRLGLQAQRELRESLNLCMRAVGMLQPEGVNVNIDARRQSVELFSKLSLDELRALAHGKPFDGSIDSEATQGGRAALAAPVELESSR